jgi:hypothetical protein
MLFQKEPSQIAEHEATGEIEEIYHDIRQTLRVSGVNLNFRTWAAYPRFFTSMWEAVRGNLQTRAFEDAADQIRAEAVTLAQRLGRVDARSTVELGDSQAFHVSGSLDLYHYINPKLLVLTSMVLLALEGDAPGGGSGASDPIARGIPPAMLPMEMTPEAPDEGRLRRLFRDIKATLGLSSINSDYRTLGLWPGYLQEAWIRLKPIVRTDEYAKASDDLLKTSRQLARRMPHTVTLSAAQLRTSGEDVDAILNTTAEFERLLPPLVLNIALLELDWYAPETLRESPFPAPAALATGGVR